MSHKVIVSRDAHGCSIRICEPCEKEAAAPASYGVAVVLLTPRILREVPSVGPRRPGRVVGVPAPRATSSRVATSPPRILRRSPRRAPYASPTQVKVEKKDEPSRPMRKLMGGAADEEEEEGQ